jgi:ubiquinone/menaquinone biosynthesis C-methylase UbiE
MEIKGLEDTVHWYDEHAQEYSKAVEPLPQLDEIDEFSSLLPKDARVLDVGCAGGRDSKLLAKRGFEVTGVDLSSGLIGVAKKKSPDIEFVQANFLDLPFPENSFEGVWAQASLLHLESVEDVKKALSEFFRVLKKKGVVHITVKAQTGEDKFAVVSDKLSKHDRFFQFFRKEEVEKLLEEAGFEPEKVEQTKETEKNPEGRPEVEWIRYLGRKG